MEDDIKAFRPTHVLNAAGVTGRPNVDWCESHRQVSIRHITRFSRRQVWWLSRFLTLSGCLFLGCIRIVLGGHSRQRCWDTVPRGCVQVCAATANTRAKCCCNPKPTPVRMQLHVQRQSRCQMSTIECRVSSKFERLILAHYLYLPYSLHLLSSSLPPSLFFAPRPINIP